MTKYIKNIVFISLLILILIFSIFRFYGEKIVLKDNICDYPMLWLHAAGSQERLKYASRNNYCGVEIDTTVSSNRGLIASYNKPNDLKASKIDDLISNNTNIKYWWLDLKNLNYSNASQASMLIENLSLKYKKNIFLIESHNFFGLWFLSLKPNNLYKTYWLAKGPNQNSDLHWSTPFYFLRSVFANIFIDPDFISMFHHQVGNNDILWVGNRQRFAFTVNILDDFEILSDKGVNVILTDNL